MKLKYIVGIQGEVGEELNKYAGELEVYVCASKEEIMQKLQECFGQKSKQALEPEAYGEPEESEIDKALLVASTDETICWGRSKGFAVMAYENPKLPKQSFSGVDMLVEGFEEVEVSFLNRVYQRAKGLPWTIAETERCVIRELSLTDIPAMMELYEGENITRFAEAPYPYEEELVFQRAYIENMYRFYGYGMWLVFLKEDKGQQSDKAATVRDEERLRKDNSAMRLIGRAGLEHREYNGEIELELGYLIHTDYQRQGYAAEICEKILELAPYITDFSRINCLIHKDNSASIHLAGKLGFCFMEEMGEEMLRYVRNFRLL